MGDKFDFGTASRLVEAVNATASSLEMKNEQLEKKFLNLRTGFNDSGYDKYAADMSVADTKIKDVIVQLKIVGKHISEYSEKLKGI